MLLRSVLFLFTSFVSLVSGADFCYYSQLQWNQTCTVPVLWGLVSQTCNGRSQSPVNIVTSKVLPDERLTPFHFTGYKETFYGSLINNGHSVQLNLPSSIQIKEGNLDDEYKAIQLHLHWGKDGGRGSEHTINGEKFPIEMHIVHIKEEYDSLAEASKDSTGVAVLGFFFQESESANEKYDNLINALKYISQPKTNVTLLGVSLDMFIPSEINRTKYFRYKGSLTTPDCAEAVVWTLFESTIPLSRNQLAAFNQLQFYDGQKMVNNYRPVQPLNGRQVYYSRGQLALVSSVLFTMSVLLSSASFV
ncbi:carbonic anhydrase 4-like [Pelmatolapia mariae]|uniref:carbonic anhydrase 4-like n=1 Tax=Pelmatolapia mariae TaxID=158779 RepID=UPI002FE62FF7